MDDGANQIVKGLRIGLGALAIPIFISTVYHFSGNSQEIRLAQLFFIMPFVIFGGMIFAFLVQIAATIKFYRAENNKATLGVWLSYPVLYVALLVLPVIF